MHTLNYLTEAFDSSQPLPEEYIYERSDPPMPEANPIPEANNANPIPEANNANPIPEANNANPIPEAPPQEQGLSPDQEQELEFDALKKYIIYNKIRELKDKIEESSLVVSEDYKRVLYFVNIILNFFDIFEYDQLVGMVDNVVSRIEKMESSAVNSTKKRRET